MRLNRALIPVVIVMALGCEPTDRTPEEHAPKQQAVRREATVPAPQRVEPAEPAGTPVVEPFSAGGPAPTLRMGRRAQQSGQILDSDQTNVFMTYDTIRFSIGGPEVARGAVVQVSVKDQSTKQQLWQEQKAASAGDSYVAFAVGPGQLSPGDYFATIAIDDRGVTRHDFKVSSQ